MLSIMVTISIYIILIYRAIITTTTHTFKPHQPNQSISYCQQYVRPGIKNQQYGGVLRHANCFKLFFLMCYKEYMISIRNL